jgi:competence protein ComEC
VGEDVEEGFRAAGATHALSVSGLHLTAVAGLAFLLLRRGVLCFPALALRLRPAVLAAALALPVVLFYTLLTGEAVATRRAALMAAAAFGAIVVRRPFSLAPALAAAAFLLLADSPLALLDASFQLSFASVLALALVVRRRRPRDKIGWLHRARGWVGDGVRSSGAALALTAPLVAYHFGELSPASPLGNLLLVPLVELGVVPIGLVGGALAALHPLLGVVPLKLAGWLGKAVLLLARGFRAWAPVLPVSGPSAFEAAALVAMGVVVLVALRQHRRRRWLICAAALAALAATSLACRTIERYVRSDLRVTFLDVGQGDAALIEGPGGFAALVDGGGAIDGDFDPGARVVLPVLRRWGIGRLDLVVLSHPHPDHMNGLFAVLRRVPVGALWSSGDSGGNPEYDRLLTLARSRRIALGRPRALNLEGLRVEPRGPWWNGQIAAPPGLNVNDASVVVRFGMAGRWFLFTGDIEQQGEAELVAGAAFAASLASDVMKVPHHGSRTSSGAELIEAVRPRLAIISLGRRNRFGFPRAEVLDRYAQHGVGVLRTDLHGAISVTVSRDGELHATCARGCR